MTTATRFTFTAAFGAAVVFTATMASTATAATYHVDSANGNDAGPGTIANPWRSLTKINATSFAPGDRILLRRGSLFQGLLSPCATTRCSGATGAPIQIDSYDVGAVTHPPPIINGAGSGEATIFLFNQSHWEIRNLEVTNLGPYGFRYVGIQAVCNSEINQVCRHIYIGGNIVHDVNGSLDKNARLDFYGRNAGIAVDAEVHTTLGNRWDDVTIENNTVTAVDRIGIYVGPYQELAAGSFIDQRPKTTNVMIRNNTISHSGGDGILVFATKDATIESNAVHDCGKSVHHADAGAHSAAGIWTAATINTVIQKNEVYNETIAAGAVIDRMAFDTDWGSINSTIQYNYSHHNYGGFHITYEAHNPSEGETHYVDGLQVRYNVSYNDGVPSSGVFIFCGRQMPFGLNTPDIHNNTIYLDALHPTPIIKNCNSEDPHTLMVVGRSSTECDGHPCAMYFYNNIIQATTAPSGGEHSFTANMPGSVFDYNVFHGAFDQLPVDTHASFADPKFVSVRSPGIGRGSLNGLKLRAGSPALGSGVNNGILGPFDYYGIAVSPSAAPNRGAYNGPGI